MTTKKFDEMPSPNEGIDFKDISVEKVKDAWKEYDVKPEYKEFNKHDLIESMQDRHLEEAIIPVK